MMYPPQSQPALQTVNLHPTCGRHLLLTLEGCAPDLLDDQQALEALVRSAAQATGATVLQLVSQRFVPQGVTALALLAESHASLHTYPERGVAFWDCFTCGDTCDPERSIPLLLVALSPTHVQHSLVERSAHICPQINAD